MAVANETSKMYIHQKHVSEQKLVNFGNTKRQIRVHLW